MKAKIFYLTLAIVMAVALVTAVLTASVAADTPANPTDLRAAGEEAYIFLDWFANIEEDVTSYNVYRSTSSNTSYTCIATTTAGTDTECEYIDHSVSEGITYYYVVTALDALNNESGYSNEVSSELNNPHFTYDPSKTTLSVYAGSSVDLPITIGLSQWDDGWTSPIQAEMYLDSQKPLDSYPLTVAFDPTTFDLAYAGDTEGVLVTITAPAEKTPGDYEVRVSARRIGELSGQVLKDGTGCKIKYLQVLEAPTPTPSPTPEPTPSPTPEPTPSPTPEPTPSPTPEPTPSPTPEPTPTPTPEPTPTPTPTTTPTPTPTPTPTSTPASTPTPTPTPTSTPTYPELKCFIATAAYGTEAAVEIDVLRAFRDDVLLESAVGSQLVEWYYHTSPPVADFISGNSLLRTIVRELVIDPMVSVASFTQGIWGK
jgi:hypothetical protein